MNKTNNAAPVPVQRLVTRLRQLGSGVIGTISSHHCPLLNEAADKIESMACGLWDVAQTSKHGGIVCRENDIDPDKPCPKCEE
jgi:hypothetical protein